MSKRKRDSRPMREMSTASPVDDAQADEPPLDQPTPDEPVSPPGAQAGAATTPRRTRHVVCYAHRGARAHQPENTLAAFELAFNLGADAIECDVQRSRDGRLVIIHDGTVDRTTDGTGPVAEQRFAELRTLNAGARWRQQQLIPTLDETIELVARRDGRLNLEIKGESDVECLATAEAIEPVLRALPEDVRSRLLVSSFAHPAVALLKRQLPWLRVALLYGDEWRGADLLAPALAVGAEAIHPAVRLVTPDLIARTHAAGLAVNVWTANRRGLIRRLIAWGADGIFSDYPERVVAAREAAERR
ncbi:MAG TPA: glycerophosphodiester phosphodiesterase family protein [Ktedonobacterales bacterium]|nr:glycerophosphodiester phosphodiesterase family protein [Ktedonobacterales bacterium]